MNTPVRDDDPDTLDPEEGDEPAFGDLFRDFLAFEVKLFVDGLKDLVLAQGAVIAILLEFLQRKRRGRIFYGLMRVGERFEQWLGLYHPIDHDREDAPFGGANRALREAERRLRTRRNPEGEEKDG